MQCDVRELPYQEMFDIVTAIQVNHYFKKKEHIAAIKNYYDALEENGVYISFENFAPDSEEGKRLYLERWKQFQIAHGKTERETDLHIKRYGKDYFPMSIAELIEIMKDCSFRMEEILWVSYMQIGILVRK
ncbi:MAG: class I SAM-dependent methyltransferase [Bacteroidales bacterium]|nr:class I SAM-dependent methyltransferase [Clostridium sp.]MCM1203640.1 class I SAM-dependent methyltransferase [Bacteroidales bacterium]